MLVHRRLTNGSAERKITENNAGESWNIHVMKNFSFTRASLHTPVKVGIDEEKRKLLRVKELVCEI